MAILDDDDIQGHLPIDKLNIEEVPDSVTQVKLDVERIIKGTLSGVFAPVTLAGWSTPNTTPEYIRAIGGRLAAAIIYRIRLSQETPDDPEYSRVLYNEAMGMLMQVATGAVTLPEIDETIDTGARLSLGHFNTLPDPVFTMDAEF